MIDFFRDHKKISGSISIFLALLLLPIYSAIAMLIESARYRSAKEQLGELTFLGQLAILADYVDFLADDFGLYAYNSSEAAGDPNAAAEYLKNSFNRYAESVESAGSIDTRKLNKLFGIDIEQCDVRNMYSIADPTVLAYQIRSSGRYALPVSVMNKLVLADVFKKIFSFLDGANKRLGVAANCLDAASEVTEILVNYKKMKDARGDIIIEKMFLTNPAKTCFDIQSGIDWDSVDYEKLYDMMSKDADKSTAALRDIMIYLEDSMRDYFDSEPADRNGYRITVDAEQRANLKQIGIYGIYDEDNTVNCQTLLNSLIGSLPAGITNRSINSMEDYGNVIDELKEVCGEYDELQPVVDLINAYSTYYSQAGELKVTYGNYCQTTKDMAANFKGIVKSVDSADAAVKAIEAHENIEDLNKKGKRAAEYRTMTDGDTQITNENRAEAEKLCKEAAEERRKAYQEARKTCDFAVIGTTLIDKFTEEVEKEIDGWKTNFDNKFNDFPVPVTTDNKEAFITFVKKLKNIDADAFKEKFITEYDFYSGNGVSGFSDEGGKISEGILECYDKVEKAAEKEKDPPQKDFVTKDQLQNVYGVFIKAGDGSTLSDTDKTWFNFDKNNSYYFSSETIVMFYAFFVGATFLADGDNTANNFIDTLKYVLDLLKNLLPDDPYLNNHIGSQSDKKYFPANENSVYPSANINGYYNNASAAAESESNVKETSQHYARTLVTDNNYYVFGKDVPKTTYENIFGNRQPGKSIEKLIHGVTDVIDGAGDFFNSMKKFNLIKAIKSLKKIVEGVLEFVSSMVEFCIDVIQIVAAIVTDFDKGTDNSIQYVLNQLYIGYYINEHFSNRQNTKKCSGDSSNDKEFRLRHSCEDNHCSGGSIVFGGAEMEYILEGSPCEITNQHAAFYAIMMIRFLLNFSVVSNDTTVKMLTKIPYAGPVLLILAILLESNIDMMFLISGVKVPLIKSSMCITPTNIKNFSNSISTAIRMTSEKKSTWTMKTAKNGKKYREYKDNQEMSKMVDEKLQKSMKLDSESTKGAIALDYGWYINILLLLYPENTKLGRVCDLLQMRGMEAHEGFRIENCYTYVYADVHAKYSPLLPMLSGERIFPDLRSVQLNGY